MLIIFCIVFISLPTAVALGLILKATLDKLKVSEAGRLALKTAMEGLQTRYKDVMDLEAFKERLESEIAGLKQQHAELATLIDLQAFKEGLLTQNAGLQSQIAEARSLNGALAYQAAEIRRQLELYNGEQTVVDCGLYTAVYDFDISQKYKDALVAIRDEQKEALRAETATTCKGDWTVNGNKSEGTKQTKNYSRLMLRAFNGESDSLISDVKWSNVNKMKDRLEGIYQAINKLGETHSIKIERSYFQLKLRELQLSYEYQEKLKAEKDEQRRIQEKIREEEREQREAQEQVRKAEDEERRSRIALEQAKQELGIVHGEEAAQMNTRIQALQTRLAEALTNKERAKSRAEMTKAGNVYIISNIGSFGENRFKIGMTRRLDPGDRIYELGNASVPFEFDVHAMIPSDDAPQLEATLHSRFEIIV